MTASAVPLLRSNRHVTVGKFGPTARPLLLLHKTGGDETELLPFAAEAAPDRPVVALRGSVSEGGSYRFFRRLSPGVFDEDDLRRRIDELADFINAFVEHHACGKPVAIGLSNGANMAAAAALVRPDLYSGIVLLRPARPFKGLPVADLAGMPVLVVSGSHDELVPASDSRTLVDHLRNCGAVVDHEELMAGHQLADGDISAVRRWLAAGR